MGGLTMSRRNRGLVMLCIAVTSLAVAFTTHSVATRHLTTAPGSRGITVYLDENANPLNMDTAGNVHEATAAERSHATHRTFYFFGAGGSGRNPDVGAKCQLPVAVDSVETPFLAFGSGDPASAGTARACPATSARCD